MDAVSVTMRGRGDELPLVAAPVASSSNSPAGMASVYSNGRPHSSPVIGNNSIPTTHFPSHASPTRHSHTPTHSGGLNHSHNRSSRGDTPRRIHSPQSTPARHINTPTGAHMSPVSSGTPSSRYSHPLSSPHRVSCSSPGTGITLSPVSNDTSQIIHEKNKSVTIVLGEQQVTYSTPDNKATSIIKISEDHSPSTKLSSITSINTTNDIATLKCNAPLTNNRSSNGALITRLHDNNNSTGCSSHGPNNAANNTALTGLQRKASYNSTAYTSNGGSTYNSSNGIVKQWNEVYNAGCLHEDGGSTTAEDWRRSTSTLVPTNKKKKGSIVSWRGVACSISGAALVMSATTFLRLPGLLLLYGPGTFLVVLVLCVLCVAAPLAFLETGLAQFSSCSVLAVWRLLPIARGVGWSMVLLCCVWGIAAAGLAAPWLHYFLVTTTHPGAIKGVEVAGCRWASVSSPQQVVHYYRDCVYSTSAEGGLGFNWPLPAGLLALCFTAFIGGGSGRTPYAAVSGVAALFAVTGLCVQGGLAVWRLSVLFSSARSVAQLLLPFLQPSLAVLATPQVWLCGLGQSLLMLGPGTALLLNHASHLPFRFPLRRHMTILTVLCLIVTLLVTSVTVLQMSLVKHGDTDTKPIAGQSLESTSFLDTIFADTTQPNLPVLTTGQGSRDDVSLSVNQDTIERLQINPNKIHADFFTVDPITSSYETTTNVDLIKSSAFASNPTSSLYETTENVVDSTLMDSTLMDSTLMDSTTELSLSSDRRIIKRRSVRLDHSTSSNFGDGLSSIPPSSTLSTLPVMSLISPDIQTSSPPPSTIFETEESASDLSALPSIAYTGGPSQPREETTQEPSTASQKINSDYCVLNIIKYGPVLEGPCSHQEMTIGSVFVLSSYGLLPHNAPLAWLRSVVAALTMCGVLCSGVGSVCGSMYVAGVAGRDSGGFALVVGAGAALLFTLGGAAPLVAQGGYELLSLLDVGVLVPALVVPTILMTTAIAAAHGFNKLRKDFTFMIEKSISVLWVVWWAFVIPAVLLGVLVWQCVYWWQDGYVYSVQNSSISAVNSTVSAPSMGGNNYNNNVVLVQWWQMGLVWLLRVLLALPIPVVAIRVINSQLAYGLKDKLISSLQSSREWGEWGPQDPIEHHNWRRWREDETRPFASLERRFATRPLTYTHSTLSRNSSGVSSLARLKAKYQKKEFSPSAVATAL